jgi:hypothetical protein
MRSTHAKDFIFKAQDAAEGIEDEDVRREAKKLLACARSDLEQLSDLLYYNPSPKTTPY